MPRAKKPRLVFFPPISTAVHPSVLKERKRREKLRKAVAIGARDKRGRFIKKKRRLKPQEVAREFGIDDAIDYAQRLEWHPDDWAETVADDFDVAQHDIYDAYFGYAPEGASHF